MLKVVKFGGSSLASSEQFARVKAIVESDPDRKVVVVSAPGKRFKDDTKVTDLLYICLAHFKYHASFLDVFEQIADRYREICRGCGLTQDLEKELAFVEESMNAASSVDEIVSRGEYLNAKLMAEYLGYTFIDSKDWLRFNYDGRVDFEGSYEALQG
ncbi:MAG: aspartate kinase, partial [Clostridia bacterium]|nr:aspartate kinase [Clostridia bacterium]